MDKYSLSTANFTPPSVYADREKSIRLVRELLYAKYGESPKAFVHTYGCQGNVSDSEKIKGLLREMGYEFVSSPENADFVLFNTCAVREHAEDRVFGNVGALKPIKEKRRDMIIALCGCMMQQEHIAEKIKKSYPYVNIVFGTFAISRLPQMMYKCLSAGKRVFDVKEEKGAIDESLPVERDRGAKVWLPIMYGCDNFCSYCIVPYVRGRERSRTPENILNEAKELIAGGAKDITLLGQNVNSYGKNLDGNVNFASVLRMINALPGDFLIRFMTSHPKDCTYELLDAMAECGKVAKHLHLPVQSGNNRILGEMNRRYTREQYLDLIHYAKSKMPDLSITSDIIVGFPGETYSEFLDTVSLVKEVEYTSLFTFIYSKRKGTKAAEMDDPVPYEEKSKRFRELCAVQEEIAGRRTALMVGKTYRVLTEPNEKEGILTGRTQGNISIEFSGDDNLIGKFVNVKITKALTWILYGELC
ncbi:MAG: tRNA (N6-isopentenyl adenosine(37)-C2)-methylthiotransferase MiaB [Clostridiales bacterium]|nr:tRNA (N6-isopentenyl adenosine(37)-C2)-methylthiotransferase MiaB [Clostridiales bacterium]